MKNTRSAAAIVMALLGSSLVAGGSVLYEAAPVYARCVGSGTQTTSSGFGQEYNVNTSTCNGDKFYFGNFDDLSTSVSIRMRWDLDQNGTYDGYSGNSSTNVADTPSGLSWSYNDADSASWYQICNTNGSGGIISCASRGTNSGY